MMASLKIGAVFIPLNHQLTVYELETIVKEAKLKVLVIDEEFSEVLLKVDAVKRNSLCNSNNKRRLWFI